MSMHSQPQESKKKAASSRTLYIGLPSDTWADSVRRGFYSTADQTVLSAQADVRIGRTVVVNHPRGVKSHAYRAIKDRHTKHTGLQVHKPWSLTSGRNLTEREFIRRYKLYDLQVKWRAHRGGVAEPVLLSFNIWHASVCIPESHWAKKLVFYAQDDETAFAVHAPLKDALSRAYSRIAASGMTVAAVSEELLDRINPRGAALLIPNGLDPALWSRVGEQPPRKHSGVKVCYVGTIDNRLDLQAIRQIGERGIAVDLIGPVADAIVEASLLQIRNVRLLGMRGRSEIVRELMSADVCLLAHVDSLLTKAMSPLKLYEYVASGTPVVSTSLPGTRGLGDNVVLVPPGGDYISAVESALKRGRMDGTERLNFLTENSWRKRHEPLLDLVLSSA